MNEKARPGKRAYPFGWWLKREGGNHEIWTNGEDTEPVPRHREVKENLAKKIIQVARNNPPKKK